MDHEKLRGLVFSLGLMGPLIFSDLAYYDCGEFGRHHPCLFFSGAAERSASEGEDVFLSRLAIVPKDKTSDNRQPAANHIPLNQTDVYTSSQVGTC